jgi:hypothetical protein
VRPAALSLIFLAACGSAPRSDGTTNEPSAPTKSFDAEDRYVPAYGKPELQRALISERAAEAVGERVVQELEANGAEQPLRVARADLAVRRRFIAALERCETTGDSCPPRLDEPAWSYEVDGDRPDFPPLTAPLRFDAASWRTIADELHGRACACRTLACVDGLGVAIARLETRPMADVQGDEVAALAITRARMCLFALRGRKR